MIRILVFNAHPRYRRRRRRTQEAVRTVLRSEQCRQAELAVIFVNDRTMRALNTTYLNHRFPTDVLSFPLSPPSAPALEGEVYVNLDQARRQAPRFDATFRREIDRLVIHGTLHLLGYDDRSSRDRSRMTKAEERYLQRIA